MSFVGTAFLSNEKDLKDLIDKKIQELKNSNRPDKEIKSYYFLRWPHKVSGIIDSQPKDFPSPEGQIFTSQWELRWKKSKHGFEILFLSKQDRDSDFEALVFCSSKREAKKEIKQEWIAEDHDAHYYPKDEIRFPRGFQYPKMQLSQRRFIHAQTGKIHFVALTYREDSE